jgi:hypothetical protein
MRVLTLRVSSLLILGSVVMLTPAQADCIDQRLVFQPSSGKLGFRVEIVPTESGGEGQQAHIYRPFHSTPETYQIVTEQPSGAGSRYLLVGPAGTLRFDVSANGTAVVESNREIPSRWQLAASPDCPR